MVDHEEQNSAPIQEDVETLNKENIDYTTFQWKHLKKSLTPKEILAQAILFLFAGSETSATTLGYVGLLLAKHPEIQKKLYEEIQKAYDEHVIYIIF